MCNLLHGEFVGPACGHHGPYIPDVLFWSIILFFTTFILSSFLKQFKTESYFPTKVWRSPASPPLPYPWKCVCMSVCVLRGLTN